MSDWATAVAAIGAGAVSFAGGVFVEVVRSRSEGRSDVAKRSADADLRWADGRQADLFRFQEEALKDDGLFGDLMQATYTNEIQAIREQLRRQAAGLQVLLARIGDQELWGRTQRYLDAQSAVMASVPPTNTEDTDTELRVGFKAMQVRAGELLQELDRHLRPHADGS